MLQGCGIGIEVPPARADRRSPLRTRQGSRPCVTFPASELVTTVATFLLFSRNSTPPRRETTGKLFQCVLWIWERRDGAEG